MRGSEIISTVDHLPEASVLTMDGVTWEVYEQILEDLQESLGVRITYDRGRLEIVTTSTVHEVWKEFILLVVYVLCEELQLNLHSCGGTTWLSKLDLKGAEADTCFYVGEAGRVMRKDDINLEVDPPPDVVVEIDKSGQSLHKFSIYATFRVPEIWRCDIKRRQVEIYELRGQTYVEINASRSFPILTNVTLMGFIGQMQKDGQMSALAAVRQWVRKTMALNSSGSEG